MQQDASWRVEDILRLPWPLQELSNCASVLSQAMSRSDLTYMPSNSHVCAGTKDQWHTFNDEVVVLTPATAVATPNAYILFYVRRDM